MGAKPALAPSLAVAPAWPRLAIGSQFLTTAAVVAADSLAFTAVLGLTVLWRHLLTPAYHLSSAFELLPYLAMLLLAFWIQGLYPGVLLHPAEEMRRIVFSVSSVFLIMASTTFLWRTAQEYSRSVFLVAWAAGIPAALFARYLLRRALASKPWWGIPALVLGSGPTAQRVVRSLRDGMSGVKVAGVLSSEPVHAWPAEFPPLLAPVASSRRLSNSAMPRYVIVAMPEKSTLEMRHLIEDHCSGFSHVLLVPEIPGLCSLGVSAREIGSEFGLEMPQRLFHWGAAVVKRGLDLFLAVAALLFASPVFLLVASCIKLSSRGPVFYRDRRLGRGGAAVNALKFRTMVPHAASVLADYLAAHPEHRLEWQRDHKLKNDPRITAIGKWLRRFSLDELPQLLNVISGEMSLVGPRPIVQAEVEKYGRGYDLYTRVRPGLTGLWQVSGRNNTTYAERVSFDEYYVRNWSIWLDAYILLRTVKVVLTGHGAY